jgi:hypothetical protein
MLKLITPPLKRNYLQLYLHVKNLDLILLAHLLLFLVILSYEHVKKTQCFA